MQPECVRPQLCFEGLGRWSVVGRFDGGRLTTDGGVVRGARHRLRLRPRPQSPPAAVAGEGPAQIPAALCGHPRFCSRYLMLGGKCPSTICRDFAEELTRGEILIARDGCPPRAGDLHPGWGWVICPHAHHREADVEAVLGEGTPSRTPPEVVARNRGRGGLVLTCGRQGRLRKREHRGQRPGGLRHRRKQVSPCRALRLSAPDRFRQVRRNPCRVRPDRCIDGVGAQSWT